MRKIIIVLICFIASGVVNGQSNTAPKDKITFPEVDIPFEKFVLDNGLTLIVHEDHKVPIIAFNIWYHVGSKNEKPGKTGFAHLFEHLMFNGSEHNNDDYFKLTDKLGVTGINGTTNSDRTNYFENFPTSALEKILWAESDRMGFMVNAIDSAKLNEQRGVVQNEKRQGENQPYAIAYEITSKNTYPAGHPYSWTVIGSMDDLNAASLEDVKEWFKTYYGPNNAVICIAGDINAQDALREVKKYFGDLPASPPISKQKEWIAKMTGTHEVTALDRVPQARLQKTWNVPGWGTKELTQLDLLSNILASGKTSRLYKRLVYDEQIASSVSAFVDDNEIGGQFYIIADAKPGVELSKINSIIDEELKKIIAEGPSESELNRAKTSHFAGFIKGMERIGGFGGISDILAENECYGGDAGYYKITNDFVRNTTVGDIKKQAEDWLTDGEFILKINPYGTYTTDATTINRSIQPPLGPAPEINFPDVQTFDLSNGLKVWLVERNSVPVVRMDLIVNAGYASDKMSFPGVATMSGNMMKEGTQTKTSLQISDDLIDLGASLSVSSNLDNTFMRLNSLKSNFEPSLDLFADVLLHPVFPQKDFERVKKEQLLNIQQEENQPIAMGIRVLPQLIYGKNHSYSMPLTGSGTTESVEKISREDLVKFHDSWFKPNNASLVVVGDIDKNELKQYLEKALSGWKSGKVPSKNIGSVQQPQNPVVYIMDKPGALQSVIFAAETAPSESSPNFEAIEMMNKIIGGEFTARINMNLREDKHWAYGAYSVIFGAKGPSFFLAYSPVQTDKTKESVSELKKELDNFVAADPATAEEFDKVQTNSVLALPGVWETNAAVSGSLQDAIIYDRGIKYLKNYPTMLRGLKLNNIRSAATEVIRPKNMTWLIVGDKEKIAEGIKELNIGTLHYLDAQGNIIQ